MQVQMRLIKAIVFCAFFCSSTSGLSQKDSIRTWSGESAFMLTVYRLGSYQKERPTFFFEQSFNYRLNQRFSIGAGVGINVYPGALGLPVGINGRYHYRIGKVNCTLVQSYHRNLNVGELFFSSYRYMGELIGHFKIKDFTLNPKIGYNFLYDKYDGRNLGFLMGISAIYPLKIK